MTNKKKVRALSPHVLLSYLMVITFVLTGVSFARFGTTKTAEDAAKAAIFTITKSTAQTFTDSVYLTSDVDDPSTQHAAFLYFDVTSTSEVPVTYDITLTAPTGDVLPDGLEWYLSPALEGSDDYDKRVTQAQQGVKRAATFTHRPNGATTVTFAGCAVAPAGTHTTRYMLHVHYETKDNVTNSGIYTFTGMKTQYIPGIKITASARDGRNNATSYETNTIKTTYTTPYTPE